MATVSEPSAPPFERSTSVDGAQAPLGRTLRLARRGAGRLALASLLGAGAVGAGIGLIATSAWLISRASQRPQESALTIAIVGVQFFGLSRGLFRYGQRLVAHDVAFRSLAQLRVSSYERLEALAPAGLPAFRSGDLLARIVHDIDSLQDLMLRVIPPFAIAVLVGAGTVALMWLILPAAGLIILIALALATTALTWLTGRLARSAEAEQALLRGELTAAVVDLLQGGAELTVFGALDEQVARTAAIDARLTEVVAASARTAGVGQGSATLLSGLAMWGALVVGVAAVRSGAMDGLLLAVIALVPLAAFEFLTDLPTATQALSRVRRAAARTFAIIDAKPPVTDPIAPVALPAGRAEVRLRGLSTRYSDAGPWALDGIDLDLVPGRTVAIVGRSGAGKSTLAEVLLRFLPYQSGSVALDGVEISELDGDQLRRVDRPRLARRAYLRHDDRGEPADRETRRDRGRAALGTGPRRPAGLGRRPAAGTQDAGRRQRRQHLRRSAPAARACPRAAGGLPGAGRRRARRTPGHRDRRRAGHGPACDHDGSVGAADHAPRRRARDGRRADRARPRSGNRTWHARPVACRGRVLREHVGSRGRRARRRWRRYSHPIQVMWAPSDMG